MIIVGFVTNLAHSLIVRSYPWKWVPTLEAYNIVAKEKSVSIKRPRDNTTRLIMIFAVRQLTESAKEFCMYAFNEV